MKKVIKCLLIIGGILLLIKLYVPPTWNSTLPDSIREAKKAGALVGEYQINYIETIDSTVVFPVFKSIWISKWCDVKRNKLGMIHLEATQSSNNYICFNIENKDTLLNMENYLKKWKIEGGEAISTSTIFGDFSYSPKDTIYYVIYQMKDSYPHKIENLIPLFRMELIPK